MISLWSEQTVAEATGGEVRGHFHASRVEIDSRKIQLGDLFVAIKGERVDGHHYVADAFARGAVAALVSHVPDGAPRGAAFIVVPDTLKALEQMANLARARSKAKVVGITGSVGKTSAKEMMKLALSAYGKTYATTGNYNNHIGTPLNLSNLPPEAKYAVFEMGMNHAGEIAHLTNMVKPHVALITNVEAVHLEFFASVEAIAHAKAEIFQGVLESGVALLPADNPHVGLLATIAKQANIRVVKNFGSANESDAQLVSYMPTRSGCDVVALVQGQEYRYTLNATGKHFAISSLAVLLACSVLELPLMPALDALARYGEVEGRGKAIKLPLAGGGYATLIDDSYNASPVSMRAAFAKLDEVWQLQGKAGRKLAALGDMRELGDDAPMLHAALSDDVVRLKMDRVFTAGVLMKHLETALPAAQRGGHVMEAAQLLPILKKTLLQGDVLLVKGSHGSLMYQLAAALQESFPPEIKNAV